MIDPDEIAADEEAREYLTKLAGLAGHYFDALKAAKVPDTAAVQMLIDWHGELISDELIEWRDDDA